MYVMQANLWIIEKITWSDPGFFNSPWQIISLKTLISVNLHVASNCPLQASFDFYKVNVLIHDSV